MDFHFEAIGQNLLLNPTRVLDIEKLDYADIDSVRTKHAIRVRYAGGDDIRMITFPTCKARDDEWKRLRYRHEKKGGQASA